jgi:uncharacterized repeat protein (TIGR03803 family)
MTSKGPSQTSVPEAFFFTIALVLLLTLGGAVVPGAHAQATYTVLYSFGPLPDGEEPSGTLVRDKSGNLYGTTTIGGAYNLGTVFTLTPSGKETVLYSFSGGTDGAEPGGELILGDDGMLYGTTYEGGNSNCYDGCGTVFKVDRRGQESVLYRFAGIPDGQSPEV